MKPENLEEAKRTITRISAMEQAVELYDRNKDQEFNWSRLFVNLFRTKKSASLEVGYNHDEYIGLTASQQKELADMLRRWINEDKKHLETL